MQHSIRPAHSSRPFIPTLISSLPLPHSPLTQGAQQPHPPQGFTPLSFLPTPVTQVHSNYTATTPPSPISQVHSNRSMWVAEMAAGFVNSKTTAGQ